MGAFLLFLGLNSPSLASQSLPYFSCSLDSAYQPVSVPTLIDYPLLNGSTEDASEEQDNGEGGWVKRKKEFYGSKYSHPAFKVPQRTAIVGGFAVVGGTVAMVGGLAFIVVGTIPYLLGSPGTLLYTGVGLFTGGATAFAVGGAALFVGSLSAGIVLRKLDQKAPFTGLIISGAGVATAFASGYVENPNVSTAGLTVGLLAIPGGMVAQLVTNRRHYSNYVESLSLAPSISPDGVGAVARFTF